MESRIPGDAGPAAGATVQRLVEVVDLLRRHCPWTAALDHASLLQYLVEETYELYEAVDEVSRVEEPAAASLAELRGELGDVLFQVVLHAQVQDERGEFGFADVAEGLTAKLMRRNPHVFAPDGSLREEFPASVEEIVATWQAVKQEERPARTSPFDGIPHQLPALAFASKTLQRAGEVVGPPGAPDHEAGLGRELLDLVRRSLSAGVDPERALRHAVLTYQQGADGEGRPGTPVPAEGRRGEPPERAAPA